MSLLFVLWGCLFLTLYADLPQVQTNALIDLYKSTGGEKWIESTNWLHLDPCVNQWKGVTCLNSSVIKLDLCSHNLSGTIPSTIGSLSALQKLYMHSNQLSGTIPPTIGSLSVLQHLDLCSNQLSGTIPSTIGSLSVLQDLYLSSNQLSGTIPSTIGSLSALQWLYLCSNQLSGTIPSIIDSLFVLEYLNLHSNRLSGTIPSTIGSLSVLQHLYLHSNQLSGTIPSTIGSLSVLQHLSLSGNHFCGGCFPFPKNPDDCDVAGIPFNCNCTYQPCSSKCTHDFVCQESTPAPTQTTPTPTPIQTTPTPTIPTQTTPTLTPIQTTPTPAPTTLTPTPIAPTPTPTTPTQTTPTPIQTTPTPTPIQTTPTEKLTQTGESRSFYLSGFIGIIVLILLTVCYSKANKPTTPTPPQTTPTPIQTTPTPTPIQTTPTEKLTQTALNLRFFGNVESNTRIPLAPYILLENGERPVSFKDAILNAYEGVPILDHLDKFITHGERVIFKNLVKQETTITLPECLAVYFYTLEWHQKDLNTYSRLNKCLVSENRKGARPWRFFLYYLFGALRKIPKWNGQQDVYRGVDCNLVQDYPGKYIVGKKIIWYSCTSTTTNQAKIMSFIPKNKPRTIFNINRVFSGRPIKNFSALPDEDEILIPPSSRFKIVSVSQLDLNITMIQMKQVASLECKQLQLE